MLTLDTTIDGEIGLKPDDLTMMNSHLWTIIDLCKAGHEIPDEQAKVGRDSLSHKGLSGIIRAIEPLADDAIGPTARALS